MPARGHRSGPFSSAAARFLPGDRSRLAWGLRLDEITEQAGDQCPDVVPDRPDGGEVESGGVGQVPVEVAFAGVDGAGVAASHRDHDVGGLDVAGGERFGVLAGDVESDFGHRLNDGGIEQSGGRGGRGVDDDGEAGSDDCSRDLGGDERGGGCRGDAGIGVGEGAADGDGGVGEGGGGGEPVRRADPGAD